MGDPAGAQRKGGQWIWEAGREGRVGVSCPPELCPHQPLSPVLPDPGPGRLPGPPRLLTAQEETWSGCPSSAENFPGRATFYHKNSFTFVILVLRLLIYFYCRRQHVSEVCV